MCMSKGNFKNNGKCAFNVIAWTWPFQLKGVLWHCVREMQWSLKQKKLESHFISVKLNPVARHFPFWFKFFFVLKSRQSCSSSFGHSSSFGQPVPFHCSVFSFGKSSNGWILWQDDGDSGFVILSSNCLCLLTTCSVVVSNTTVIVVHHQVTDATCNCTRCFSKIGFCGSSMWHCLRFHQKTKT